ncbi:MAG: RimK/LysX family protein, partial [Solimonas sp.]
MRAPALLLLTALLPLRAGADTPTIYGRYEQVAVPALGVVFDAKLDTGADLSSLSADVTGFFERRGERWVRFHLAGTDDDRTMHEARLLRVQHVRRRGEDRLASGGDASATRARPVIALRFCLGGVSRVEEINLTDRADQSQQLLVGENMLRDYGIAVDVARRGLAGPAVCP